MAASSQATSVGQFGGAVSPALSHILVEEAGRISGDIYRRTIDTSPWLKLVKQSAWPNEMGDTLSVLTYDRALAKKTGYDPADTTVGQKWENIKSTDANQFQIPDATLITPATTQETFGLAHTAIESAPILVNDVRFAYKFRDQLRAIYDNLVDNVSWAWKDRYRDQYYGMCKHNIVAGFDDAANGVLIEGTVAGTFLSRDASPDADFDPAKIGIISNNVMNQTYMRLIRDGGGMNPMGRSDGRPVFTAIMSAENSEKLINESGTRTDYRESGKVNELLKPLGVERSHKGFYHIIDPFPKRFTYTEDAGSPVVPAKWTEIQPYVEDGSTGKFIINPAYETAAYEDTVIYHQDVMESLVPTPLTSAGSGTTFNPNTYRGDYKFLNILDKTTNPDGSWGYFRGILANAAKPIKSQFAYIIRAKRPSFSKLPSNADNDTGSIVAEA